MLIVLPPTQTEAAAKTVTLEFHHIDAHTDPAILRFADSVAREMQRDKEIILPNWWDEGKDRLIDSVKYLEVDLNDNQVPALFLQIGIGGGCGSDDGCETKVYRRTSAGFDMICSDHMWNRILVLPKKENGYHLVDDGASIIHWDMRHHYWGICNPVGKPEYLEPLR